MTRGDAVVRPGEWGTVDEVEVALAALAGAPAPVREHGAHLAYVGSEEVAARLRVVGAGAVAAGTTGTVRLRLPRRLPLAVGDRVVLRDAGRGVTVAGGPITRLDPTAETRAPLRPSEAAVLGRIEASRPGRARPPVARRGRPGRRRTRWSAGAPSWSSAGTWWGRRGPVSSRTTRSSPRCAPSRSPHRLLPTTTSAPT